MEASIEKHVTDLEHLFIDLPEIINFRFERIDTALRDHAARFDEMGGRLNLLDKQMGMLLRDMRDLRDLRGGVTRQLVEQDKEIAAFRSDVTEIRADVSGLKTDVSLLKTDASSLKAGVSGIKADVSGLKVDVSTMKADIAGLKSSTRSVEGKLDLVLAKLG